MELDNYMKYLKGDQLSVDLHVKYSKQDKVVDKIEYIKDLIRGKKVIDVGFADHYDIIEERLANKKWVHGIFREVTSKIMGVDIDPAAIDHIKAKLKIEDLYCHDITSSNLLQPILEENWDFLVLSEVLEHVSNPADFLSAIKSNYGSHIKRLIISVPNAFGAITLRSALNGVERINSDHRYWFTPYTLAKVVLDAGCKIDDFVLCNSYYPLSRFERMLVKRSPLLHHTLVMVVTL
jgi:2-polyprenyl-3-methyl-5-hydroxy-6-metoxy-1,4-benzoquinol methylase